ncbi:HK97 family phage prohead protease/HK97 family phage major capsid protein,TIGR01554 [Ciceribacter lividus]|uniref:HK97 family phage prohead protease/HK97 family phage major capsid protein,TIGR01554 n=1 Tax=Ciceribacter lividus TaxID=1197950 RepID=A0A6I7HS74_9HYPH|nr:phage major capsid protein [Ciceribacter lividus]RCW27809.1 HK97 family phage prohead protease/HK97 family phage major capsid protein,TIGR01554 [Ciceribacter lividus]
MTAATLENLEIKAEVSIDDTGTVTGIAWPFGKPDSYGDLIEPSAFNFAPEVPMLMEHDGRKVVGIWNSYAVTDKGLEVKGRLFVEGVDPAKQARRHMKAGVMSGLSIGYRLHEHKARPEGGRVLTSLTITEISLCRRPVHPDARTIEVKSIIEGNSMENELQNEPEQKSDPVVSADEIKALKDEIATIKAKMNRRPVAANNNHPDASNDNRTEVKAFADFVRTGDASEYKSLGYASPSTGGILAPEAVATTILEKVAEFSPVRGLAQAIAMSGPLLQLPRLVNEVTPQSVAETAPRPEGEPTFEQIDLKAFEMAVTIPVTRILLEDAQIDLSSYLSNHLARRFGQTEAAWFVNGNGTTQAEGVLNSAEVIEKAGAVAADDLIDLFYAIKTAYSANGSWLMNRKTMAAVRKLKDTDGSYIWQPALSAGQPATLLGRPVYEGVDMPDVAADATPIVFGDFASGYAIADRVGFELTRDDLTGADNGIVKLRGRRRVGGRVVMGEALAKLKIA